MELEEKYINGIEKCIGGFTSRLDKAEESVAWNTGSGTHGATKSKKGFLEVMTVEGTSGTTSGETMCVL